MYMAAYLIADDLALLDIVQSRDRKATLVVGTDFEIDIPKVTATMNRVGSHIVTGKFLFRRCKPPAWEH